MNSTDSQFDASHTAKTAKAKSDLKLTQADKEKHVQAYLKSNQTRQMYCESHDLKLSSFKNWLTRYGHKRKPAFVPVVNRASTVEMKSNLASIEMRKGDYRIAFYDIANVDTIIAIIKGVLSCS